MDSSSNVKEVKEKGETTTATVDVDVDAPSSLPARPRIWKQSKGSFQNLKWNRCCN